MKNETTKNGRGSDKMNSLVGFLFRRTKKPQPEEIIYINLSPTFPVKRMSVGRLPGGDRPTKKRPQKKRARFEQKIAVLAGEQLRRLDRSMCEKFYKLGIRYDWFKWF